LGWPSPRRVVFTTTNEPRLPGLLEFSFAHAVPPGPVHSNRLCGPGGPNRRTPAWEYVPAAPPTVSPGHICGLPSMSRLEHGSAPHLDVLEKGQVAVSGDPEIPGCGLPGKPVRTYVLDPRVSPSRNGLPELQQPHRLAAGRKKLRPLAVGSQPRAPGLGIRPSGPRGETPGPVWKTSQRPRVFPPPADPDPGNVQAARQGARPAGSGGVPGSRRPVHPGNAGSPCQAASPKKGTGPRHRDDQRLYQPRCPEKGRPRRHPEGALKRAPSLACS